MTDRLNELPSDDPATAEAAAEAAVDLTDAEIAAAGALAQAEIGEDLAGGDTVEESEAIDEDLDAADADDLDARDLDEDDLDDDLAPAGPATRPGARARAAEAAAARANRTAKGPRATRTAFPIDPALRIKDPASQIFVTASIAFFVLVFLYAMAFGRGGAFTPVPTPTPFVSPSPAPIVSPAPSGSPGASGSAPSAVPTVVPTAAPTAAPAS